jgi:hypothetical protein
MPQRKVTRADIAQVLDRWEAGGWSAQQVHVWADDLYFPGSLEFDDRFQDDASVANCALSELSCLDINFITTEDIAIFRRALESPLEATLSAIDRFEVDLKGRDIDLRRRELIGKSPYDRILRHASGA